MSEDDDIDPRTPFFMSVPNDNLSGKFESGDVGDCKLFSTSLKHVEEEALRVAEEHGVETFIYKVVPLKRVYRPRRAKIEELGKAPTTVSP